MRVRPKAKSGLGANRNNQKGTKGDVLKIVLNHGDLVVMHGSDIQKYYEVVILPSFTSTTTNADLACCYPRRKAPIRLDLPLYST